MRDCLSRANEAEGCSSSKYTSVSQRPAPKEPDRAARLMADKGLARYEDTMQTLREIPYGTWRAYNPEEAVRFYACGCATSEC